MRAFWFLSQNFGDMLTCALVQKITGQLPQFVSASDERRHMVGVGSILSHATASSVVWGAGIGNMADDINPAADVRLVRGPLSAARFLMGGGKKIERYGDPALLCPRLFGEFEKQHDLGFVPHYIDQSHWAGIAGAKYINVLDPPEKVVADIASCRAVVSSSLHGLIVADAYGIPAGWLFSPRVLGDGTKFADHFMAVSGEVPLPMQWEALANESAENIIGAIPPRSVSFDADAILGAFPRELV